MEATPMTAPSGSLDAHLAALRSQINDRLAAYVGAVDDCPPRLQEAMAYSLLAGGKRLRPVLLLLACEACGGEPSSALPAACALEMVHTYSLIHDDLPAMDNDDLRRGRPTNHVVYGEALAILAGDGLLTLAFEVMARDTQPPALAAACCLDLAAAAGRCGMVGGQVVDIEAEHQPVRDVSELEGIHRRKTGRLLCSALTLGGRLAGATPQQMADLEIYGKCVGLAFQITDDLLDVSSTPEKMGKHVQKDASLGKLTYPELLRLEESRRRADTLVAEACHRAEQFGERGRGLKGLAEFIRERDH
jgi:geranylgeranyl diphosphate synthase, type II